MAKIVQLLDAVVDCLNSGSFTPPFRAVKAYRPAYELTGMDSLHVTVMPRAAACSLIDRTTLAYTFKVDIAVQQKLPSDSPDNLVEQLLDLLEQISEYLAGGVLSAGDATWQAVENEPIYIPEHAENLRQFTGVLTVTYRMIQGA